MKNRLKDQLIKNSGIYIITNFLTKGISFLMIPFYTRYLSPNEYGEVSQYMLYSTIIYLVLSLQNYSTIGVVKESLSDDKFKEYLKSICIIPLMMLLIALLLIKFFQGWIYLKTGLNIIYQNMLIIQSFFYIGFTLLNSIYIYTNESIKKVKVTFFFTLAVTLFSLFSLVLIENKISARINSYFIVCTIFGIYSYRQILKNKLEYKFENIKLCLRIGTPLVFYSLSYFLLNGADRIILKKMTNDLEVGVYSLAYNIGVITNLIWSSINAAWTPWLYNKMKKLQEQEIREKSYVYLKIIIIINILFVWLGIDLFEKIVPKYYINSFDIIPWIVLGNLFIFFYSFSVNYKTFIKKTKSIGIISFITLLINIYLNIMLIPKYGSIGAAKTTAISYLIGFLLFELDLRKNYKIKYFKVVEYLEYTAYLIASILFYYCLKDYFLYKSILNILLIVFIIKRKRRNEKNDEKYRLYNIL